MESRAAGETSFSINLSHRVVQGSEYIVYFSALSMIRGKMNVVLPFVKKLGKTCIYTSGRWPGKSSAFGSSARHSSQLVALELQIHADLGSKAVGMGNTLDASEISETLTNCPINQIASTSQPSKSLQSSSSNLLECILGELDDDGR